VLWDAWIDPANPPSRACVGVQLQGDLKAEFIIRAAARRLPVAVVKPS
jgi:hypothetical protein